jgi:hypothetical protein
MGGLGCKVKISQNGNNIVLEDGGISQSDTHQEMRG